MWELWMHLVYDLLYIHFQIRQIPATNYNFYCEKDLLLCWSRFLKKNIFPVWDLVTTGKQIEKTYFVTKKNTSKLWRTWSMVLPVYNVLSHSHFFKVGEIMSLKYGNSMLLAGHILDLYLVRLSNAVSFCENYTKLYFDKKHLKKGIE